MFSNFCNRFFKLGFVISNITFKTFIWTFPVSHFTTLHLDFIISYMTDRKLRKVGRVVVQFST